MPSVLPRFDGDATQGQSEGQEPGTSHLQAPGSAHRAPQWEPWATRRLERRAVGLWWVLGTGCSGRCTSAEERRPALPEQPRGPLGSHAG